MPIEITGLEAIVKKMDALNDPKIFKLPLIESTLHLKRRLEKYPLKSPGAFSRLATPGQKRAYWAKVSSGEISTMPGGGYRRSGTLGKKWTYTIKQRESRLHNNVGYGPYVQGERQQSFHEASKWPKVSKVAKDSESAILGYFKAALARAVNK